MFPTKLHTLVWAPAFHRVYGGKVARDVTISVIDLALNAVLMDVVTNICEFVEYPLYDAGYFDEDFDDTAPGTPHITMAVQYFDTAVSTQLDGALILEKVKSFKPEKGESIIDAKEFDAAIDSMIADQRTNVTVDEDTRNNIYSLLQVVVRQITNKSEDLQYIDNMVSYVRRLVYKPATSRGV